MCLYRLRNIKSEGFSLVELLIVIAIIVVLLGMATLAYNRFRIRYEIEKTTKELYATLMNARLRAMQEDTPYIVQFSSNAYSTYRDLDNDGAVSGSDTIVENLSNDRLKYEINLSLGGGVNSVVFDSKGLANLNGRVWITPTGGSLSDAEYDCINITFTRINMGKEDGSQCQNR